MYESSIHLLILRKPPDRRLFLFPLQKPFLQKAILRSTNNQSWWKREGKHAGVKAACHGGQTGWTMVDS